MRRGFARVRGLGFIFWHSRHELYHVLIGLVWAWFLREWWNEFNGKWIFLSIIGSLLPDADHILYFLTYGRRTHYTKQIRNFLKSGQWRKLTVFIEIGHKHNTNLSLHNIYIVMILLIGSIISLFFDWRSGVVFMGAMVCHYIFDILDDIFQLGALNPNWMRWGRGIKN